MLGRRSECLALDRLLDAVRAGESRALVVRGEPGVGKSALLEYVAGRATGCRVARAAGVQSEMELAFAGLHQLCAPMLDRLERLPVPQRVALATAFGLRAGEVPDQFFVGLAVLSLLSEVAADEPLVCLVDDAQWLDRASAQALAFAARRLAAESVALVFAVRDSCEEREWRGLPELLVGGLRDADARALLDSVITGPLDARVRDRIVAETRGNPLALLELPRGFTTTELAGGFGLPHAPPLLGRIEDSFRRRLEPLPAETRRLLLVAAAEPLGESVLVWDAARQIGVAVDAAAPAVAAGLLEFGARVRFRHPLVRSAVYREATPAERRRVHRALAEATDPQVDPDRRAWHRAQATAAPDEDVASELDRSAGRAQARGGLAAAAVFLEQAAALTLDPTRRAQRSLAAAQAKHQAGAPEAALTLLAAAETGQLDELGRAHADLLRAQIVALSRGSDAPPLLLKAARRFEPLDVRAARDTYLELLAAALFAGPLASGVGLPEAAEAARAAPPAPAAPSASDLLLDGLAVLITEGYAAAMPALKRALSAFRDEDVPRDEELRWLWLACHTAMDLWDDETWHLLSDRFARLAREAGALSVLPVALSSRIGILLLRGEFAAAASVKEELEAVTVATGNRLPPYGALALVACEGREGEANELIDATVADVTRRGEGVGLGLVHWARTFIHNCAGRYEDALAAAEPAREYSAALLFSGWGLIEVIEAAARSGHADRAAAALRQLSESTRASGSDWALAIEARSRALQSEGKTAERLYREAIDRLGRTHVRLDLARTHLLYGEWLRRERRRLDAREHLRTAHEMFASMGAEALARRAARELLATGETARKRTVDTRGHLTAQEAQIAQLARDGLSNAEIGSRLFISPRTVEYHLRKVFAKFNISSRHELDPVLADAPGAAQPG